MTQRALADCHCGSVVIELPSEPVEVTECNCSICRRYAVLWAYYAPTDVSISARGGLDQYSWDDRSIDFNRCRTCGCLTHWSPNDGRNLVGVNARLLPLDVLARARRRHLDGAVTEQYVD